MGSEMCIRDSNSTDRCKGSSRSKPPKMVQIVSNTFTTNLSKFAPFGILDCITEQFRLLQEEIRPLQEEKAVSLAPKYLRVHIWRPSFLPSEFVLSNKPINIGYFKVGLRLRPDNFNIPFRLDDSNWFLSNEIDSSVTRARGSQWGSGFYG